LLQLAIKIWFGTYYAAQGIQRLFTFLVAEQGLHEALQFNSTLP
jgi:hypothetical protein